LPLINCIAREIVTNVVLELLGSFLRSLYMVVLYYAALRAFSEQYAMLAATGLVLNYFIVSARSQGAYAYYSMYSPDNVLAELPVPPITVFRLTWLLSSAISSAATLANFYVLQLTLGHLRAAPPCSLEVLILSTLASPAISLFMALHGSFQHYVTSSFSLRVSAYLAKKININYPLVTRVTSHMVVLLIFFLYSAVPIYYTLESMPWWARPLALVNPQTFLIEAGRGGMSAAEAAAAIALSLCVYYAANEKLFERFVEARRCGRGL